MTEKTILCFGDSNTWGADPAGGPRFDRSIRWPCILQQELGDAFHVVEEGLCGRTTVWDDPIEGHKNGLRQLVPILKSHEPLELVIVMLGTNDLKNRFAVSALDVANSAWALVRTARSCTDPATGKAPEILVVCPPPFAPLAPTAFKDMFVGGEEKSHRLAEAFAAVAEQRGFRLFQAGGVIQSSAIDGIHFDAAEHLKLGQALAAEVRNML
ncbi:SGNH/GDSL hydrolase family protein [Pontiella sp.]|uniref:SGNH/GDSL hydrolase family protein n=1 Tax=Pontiella sp. TaxID=2837462 RepID=UPI0035670377